jgi:hypothetical protein
MKNVNFDVKVVEDIKPDEKTGKYKLIVIEWKIKRKEGVSYGKFILNRRLRNSI